MKKLTKIIFFISKNLYFYISILWLIIDIFMEFGDLLYVLLMVVAVLFSLLRKTKKQHPETPFPKSPPINLPEDFFPPGMFREEKAKVLGETPLRMPLCSQLIPNF